MSILMANTVAEPPFEDPEQQRLVWGRTWGCDNDVGTLRTVMVSPPNDYMRTDEPRFPGTNSGSEVRDQDEGWYWDHGVCPPRSELPIDAMRAQHDKFVELLDSEGIDIVIPDNVQGGRFSCYSRDVAISIPGGAIVTRLAAQQRQGEERWTTAALAKAGVPIIRTISGAGLMEGGSFAWVNSKTAVIGRSNCVNDEGIRQVREVLAPLGIEVLVVDLSMHEIHIDGSFLMLDVDLAIVNVSLIPYSFLEELQSRNIRMIGLNSDDDPWLANGLAIAPGRVLLPKGQMSRSTRGALNKHGVEVIPVEYDEMQLNGGGIHCSTCPLVRDSVD
jgi:N-dimethylarginine dimethylaminohydrolase